MKMKAAVLHEPKKLLIEEVEIPALRSDEVLVKIKATAICGTDLAFYLGKIPLKSYPQVLGHESVGIVEEVGADVNNFSKGDHVIVNPAYFCGYCFYCERKLWNCCENGGLLGRDRYGTFAEYVTVPKSSVIPLPEEISFEDGSTLQSLATVLRGWERIEGVRPPGKGDVVVVIGISTPGLLYTRLAVLSGATVFACGRRPWRLELAKQFGAIPVDLNDNNIVSMVKDSSNGRGADYVIEATGVAKTFQTGMDAARPGATILAFGIHGDMAGVSGYNLYFKELKIVGTRAMTNPGFERAIKLFQAGSFDLQALVTDRFSLDETKVNFDAMNEDPGAHNRMVCLI
ncbi:MAG: alcohol dehydrogenase catalytic domain-containing protein [Defluviitaleaceae bacterium]|nr:alcohol dehydrogenase catalytic domain-containing protein [Defluviitaleaceae bacterium]